MLNAFKNFVPKISSVQKAYFDINRKRKKPFLFLNCDIYVFSGIKTQKVLNLRDGSEAEKRVKRHNNGSEMPQKNKINVYQLPNKKLQWKMIVKKWDSLWKWIMMPAPHNMWTMTRGGDTEKTVQKWHDNWLKQRRLIAHLSD